MSENKISLKQIARDTLALQELLTDSGGEIDQSNESIIDGWLAEVQNNLAVKVDSYDWIMRRMESESDLLKARADEFYKAAKSIDNFRERLKMRIKETMAEMGVSELEGGDVVFKLSRTAPRLELNESLVQDTYKVQTIVTSVDKNLIKKDLKDGVQVEGASFVENYALRTTIRKGE